MAEYEEREQNFNASLGQYMGGWMAELTKADIDRQVAWVSEIQKLATPDKDGNVPLVQLTSGVTGDGGKPLAGATMSWPVVLAVLGEQFAGLSAELDMTMNVSAHTEDASSVDASESGEGSASIGVGPVSANVKISVSASEHTEHKRESDYRATTSAKLVLGRVPTPEPVQRMLQAYLTIVDVEADLVRAQIQQQGQQKQAQLADGNGGDAPAPEPTPDQGDDN